MNRRAESFRDAAQHAQGVSLIGRRFEAADLLLGRAKFAGKILLRKPSLLAERGDLQSDIPSFARFFEACGEIEVFKLLLQVGVEIGLFHDSCFDRQSLIRSNAVFRSLAGISHALFRMPCTATIRCPRIKK